MEVCVVEVCVVEVRGRGGVRRRAVVVCVVVVCVVVVCVVVGVCVMVEVCVVCASRGRKKAPSMPTTVANNMEVGRCLGARCVTLVRTPVSVGVTPCV